MANSKPNAKGAGHTPDSKRTDSRRIEILEKQLTIFAQEFHDRLDAVEDMRREIEDVRSVLLHQLAELRDVYLMHKRHLEETIEIIDLVRHVFTQLDVQLSKGGIVLTTSAATSWYQTFRRANTRATRTVLRQKEELAPYLAEDWKPPELSTWAGQLARLADTKLDVDKSATVEPARPKKPASPPARSAPSKKSGE